MRALIKQEPIPVRNPSATRPWQHVLEPLGGYLCLAENIYKNLQEQNFYNLNRLCSPFNFGPNLSSNQNVKTLVENILNYWPGEWLDQSDPHAVHEANLLNLVIDKAFHLLQWQPNWNFEKTIEETVLWYRDSQGLKTSESFQDLTLKQIKSYQHCSSIN
jgi:CDP-glucose 4,6-dehydratase